MSDAVFLKNSEETLYSGYLTKGEERKDGTQVAFKGKERYFVLKCLGNKLLTMSAYKDENDFRNLGRKGKSVNPDRFRDTYNQKVKVHKMQMMVKKHRTADILCIVQDKRPLYLEAKNRSDLDGWYNAFNTILIRLGWKEGAPPTPGGGDQRPISYPQTTATSSTDQVNGDRHSTPSVMEGAFESPTANVIDGGYIGLKDGSPQHAAPIDIPNHPTPPPYANPDEQKRLSGMAPALDMSPPKYSPPPTPTRSPRISVNKDRRSVPLGHCEDTAHEEDNCKFCCQRHHLVGDRGSIYVNIHPVDVDGVSKWRRDVSLRREKLVDVRQFYAEYIGPPDTAETEFSHRYNAERRRSKSTSDLPIGLAELQGRPVSRSRLWDPPDDESVPPDDKEIPPRLPERGASIMPNKPTPNKPTPTPRQRRTGAIELPHDLQCDLATEPNPVCPVSPSIVKQFLTKHHPLNPPVPRERKISAPTSPPNPHLYINAPHLAGPEEVVHSPLRRGHGSMIDVRRRPLPSPNGERPSSLVQTLQWEQGLCDGIPIVVPKRDLNETLALVKIADYVWIAGKRRGCPDSISKNFHVGDQLRQINEQIVVDVTIAHALFKTTAKEEVTLLVRRIPHAKIFTIRRSTADVGWGLSVEGNKVLDVPRSGPAFDAGIKARPEGALSKRLCSWIITQINSTPVSLCCSRDAVKTLLDNQDMEMSIILQPEDFINKVKSELQSVRLAIDYY